MRLFGWKSGGAAMRPALAQTMTGWVADGRWPRGYDEQVREAVLANPVAQRAVRLVGESVASLTWIATGGPEAATGLIRPVAEAIASHLLLHGNAFLSIGCGGQGDPIRLHDRAIRTALHPAGAGAEGVVSQ